jgi:hypothetical protein
MWRVEPISWKARPLPTYRISYRPGGRDAEEVRADELRREGGWLVLRRCELVVGMPRLVVALRVPLSDVRHIVRLG